MQRRVVLVILMIDYSSLEVLQLLLVLPGTGHFICRCTIPMTISSHAPTDPYKSDILYPKTSWAFDVAIHSRALLAAILCLLAALVASRVANRFWRFRSRSASHRHVYVGSASQYPSRTRNCATLLTVATQSSCLNCRSRLKYSKVAWQQRT